MNKVKFFLAALAACALLASRSPAAPGATQSEFLKIGLSARAAAMGGAFGAVADDLGAMEYNPAGLGLLTNTQFSAMYARWLADINFGGGSFGYVMPYMGTVAVSVAGLSMDPIEGDVKKFDASSYLVRVALGRAVLDNLTVGVGGKVIRESISNLNSAGGTLDGGLLFVPFQGVTLGAAVMNAGKTSAFDDKSDALPLLLKFAGAWKGLGGDYGMVVAAVDLDWYVPPESLFYPAVGVEYWGGRNFALRAGYAYRETDLTSEAAGLSVGIGVRWESLRLDYAYAPFSSLGNTHRVTFNWEIAPLVSLPVPGSSVGELRTVMGGSVLPSPPSAFAEPSERSVLVKWEETDATDVAGYNVYYHREGDTSWKKFNQEPVTGSTILVTGLVRNARYYFHVRAVNDAQPPRESAPSPQANAVPF